MRNAISYWAMRVRISGSWVVLYCEAVEGVDGLDGFVLGGGADAGGILDVEDGIAEGVELDALKVAGQDAAGPLAGGDGLHLAALAGGHEDDEAGQVVGFRAESVEDPGAHAGAAGDDGAGVHEGVGGIVVDLLGPHGADDADVVGDAADVGEERADLLSGFAEFLEGMLGAEAGEALALQLGDLLAGGKGIGHGLAGHFGELGFVVEGFEVGGAARLIEEDDALGFGGMMERVDDAGGGEEAAVEEGIQGEQAYAGETAAEEGAAAGVAGVVSFW